MLEMRITIEAPELVGALNNLAAALGQTKVVPQTPTQPQQPTQMAPVPKPAPTDITVTVNPPFAQPAQTPAPNVPLAQPPQYTIDQIMAAGATLMDAGKVNELRNLLVSFGANAVMDLKPEQLGAFATGLRELGAKI